MTTEQAMTLARGIERERCARIAEQVAAQYLVNGRIPRGSTGAKATIALAIAKTIRMESSAVPSSTSRQGAPTDGTR